MSFSDIDLVKEYGSDFIGTKRRVEKMWAEFFTSEDVVKHFEAKYKEYVDEIIVIRNIEAVTLCPHHLLPVELNISIGYLPNNYILGLSKFARVVEGLTKPPVKQECYTEGLVDTINIHLKPKWVMVIVKGRHGCMRDRGVKQMNCDVITSAIRGDTKNKTLKAEMLELLKL